MGTGNVLQLAEVKNNLKSLLTLVLGSFNRSLWINSCGSQLSNKWQLHRITQLPRAAPEVIACTALSSAPEPSDISLIVLSRSPWVTLDISFIVSDGSAPLARMKMIGVLSSVSSITSDRIYGVGFAYSSPIFSLTYFFIMNMTFSGLTQRMNRDFLNESKNSNTPGIVSSWILSFKMYSLYWI
jgi:hypothetical protein